MATWLLVLLGGALVFGLKPLAALKFVLLVLLKGTLKLPYVFYRGVKNYRRPVPLELDTDGTPDGFVSFWHSPWDAVHDWRLWKVFVVGAASILELLPEGGRIALGIWGRRYRNVFDL